jgi:hypothetical protein
MSAWDRSSAVKDDYKSIQLFGYNGADVADYVGNGKYAEDFSHELEPVQFRSYRVVVVSGGGNDAVDGRVDGGSGSIDPANGYGAQADHGKIDLARVALGLKDDCTGIDQAKDCIDEAKMDALLRSISNSIGSLLHDVLWANERDLKSGDRKSPIQIILHGYDYPVPDGRGFTLAGLPLVGPWLSKAMDARNIGTGLPAGADLLAFRFGVSSLLIERMNSVLAGYANSRDNIFFVNSLGVLNSTLRDGIYQQDWDNEMHPTGDGFTKIFEQRWVPVLRQAGLAT